MPHSPARHAHAADATDDIDDADALVLPQRAPTGVEAFLAALPGPVRALLHLLLLSWVEPDDDFTMVLRKIVVTTGLCMFVHPVSYIGYFVYLLAQGAPAGGPAALIVACGFSMLAWSALYFVARALRSVPDAVLDLWLVFTNIAFSLLVVSMPEYPATTCVMASAILTIVCNSPRRPLFLLWCSVLFLLEEYNNAVDGTGYEALVPGARRGPMPERLVNHLSGFAIAATVLAALLMQTREHVRHVAAARASVATAQRMARHLARYDTAAVEQMIHEELRSGDGDVALFEAFASIAENLDKYRPHLPNWMLDQARADASETMSAPDAAAAADAVVEDPDMESLSTLNGSDSDEDDDASVAGSFARGSSRSTASLRQSATFGSGAMSGGQASVASMDRTPRANAVDADTSASTSTQQHPPLRSQRSRVIAKAPASDGLFQGKVAQATVCVAPQPAFEGLRAASSYGAVIDATVELALECAQASGAALHSFIGDRLVLTWNATHRVPQPEIKMCRFLAQLRAKAAAHPRVAEALTLSAAGVCAESVCRFAGSSRGQRSLHLSQPDAWYVIAHALLSFACAAQSFVVDGWTARVARHDVVHRDIEAFDVHWDLDPMSVRRPENTPSVSPSGTPRARSLGQHPFDPASKEPSPPVSPQSLRTGQSDGSSSAAALHPHFVTHSDPKSARHGNNSPSNSRTRLAVDSVGGLAVGRGQADAASGGMTSGSFRGHNRIVVASEVVCERVHKADEWMYVLQDHDGAADPNAIVSNALRLAVVGRLRDAVDTLAHLDSTAKGDGETSKEAAAEALEVRMAPLVGRLRHRLNEAAWRGRVDGRKAAPAFPMPHHHPSAAFTLAPPGLDSIQHSAAELLPGV